MSRCRLCMTTMTITEVDDPEVEGMMKVFSCTDGCLNHQMVITATRVI